ncbi:MAG: OprD family outer membrane porin [Endozoicomonas sp.]
MKLAQLSALSAAVLLASTVQANSFADDSSLNLELRNFFMDRATENRDGADGSDDSSSQWAQAIRFDYSSGYFENIVGLDLSAYYNLKLGASNIDSLGNDKTNNPGLLPGEADGDSKSYGKTAFAVKFNLADMGTAKYGRFFLDTPLVNNSDSRSLPSLSEAFYADIAYEGLSAYGVWAVKSNPKTEAGFDEYMTSGDKEPVKAVGASYDFGQGLGLSADYATQANFANKYLVEATFSQDLDQATLGLAAQYAKLSLIGDKKDDASDDTSQAAWGLKASAGMGQASFGVAYTKVESTTVGSFNPAWGMVGDADDDSGYFGYNSIQYSDFNSNGQSAWGFNAGYDFAEFVQGLSASAIYVTGKTDPKGSDGVDENELNLKVTYAFPQLDGLSAQLRYAKNTLETSEKDQVTNDTRVIVKYNVAIF